MVKASRLLNMTLLSCFLFFLSVTFSACLSSGPKSGVPLTVPMQPDSGPGGKDYRHATVTKNVYGEGAQQYWLFEPASPTPKSAPIIVFNHGWAGMYPQPYGAWIEHLVRRGNIVIYPRFQENLRSPRSEMTAIAIDAIKDAIRRLQSGGHVLPQLDKFALVGHSLGATLSVNIAAEAASSGLPQPKALMAVQPGGREESPKVKQFVKGREDMDILGNTGKIPANILMLIVLGSEDEWAGDNTYIKRIFDESPQIPPENKNLVTIVSDYYGNPPLVADHFSPCAPDDSYAAGENVGPIRARIQKRVRDRMFERLGEPNLDEKLTVNALDYYGYWKLLDGLTDAAFYGKNREYALGNTRKQRFMGRWSDGTPIKQLIVANKP